MVTLAVQRPIGRSSRNETPIPHHLDPKTATVAHRAPKRQHLSSRTSIPIPTRPQHGPKTLACDTSKDRPRTALRIRQPPSTPLHRPMISQTHTARIIGEVAVARARRAIAPLVVMVMVISILGGASPTVQVLQEFRGDGPWKSSCLIINSTGAMSNEARARSTVGTPQSRTPLHPHKARHFVSCSPAADWSTRPRNWPW